MDVAVTNAPFQREVREWQRVDPNTGALLSGRLEADRWNSGSSNKYGKVVDSQNISTPNGTQMRQRKELEVLQARTVTGSIQVVRSSTVQSSSSRWSRPSDTIDNIHNQSVISQESSNISDTSKCSSYERGRSASTEDIVSTVYDNCYNDDDNDGPIEWKRVSKIRRSLQYPKERAPKYSSRPTDLPENLVSISQIKKDLEFGYRNGNSNFGLRKADVKSPTAHLADELDSKQIKKATLITADSLQGIRNRLKRLSDESLYKEDMITSPDSSENSKNPLSDFLSTQSIQTSESKLRVNKIRDVHSSTDWYARRKSYGFEDMPSNEDAMSSRMEASTDSGLGRSGELAAPWSNSIVGENKLRGTIITLGGIESPEPAGSSTSVSLNSNRSSYLTQKNSIDVKRHSIAVDESKYVKDTTRKSPVNINRLSDWNAASILDDNNRRLRRVEFCKTEVHFAAESGRVNIVETDEKPPSTNNFRRRRRHSSISSHHASIESNSNPTAPIMMFGYEKPKDPSPLSDNSTSFASESNVKITITEPASLSSSSSQQHVISDTSFIAKSNSYSSGAAMIPYNDEDGIDEIALRGILKNKPIKPRPYHLGENLESSERLWGVRLKPVLNEFLLAKDGEREILSDENDGHNFVTSPGAATSGFSTKIKFNTDKPYFTWDDKSNEQSTANHMTSYPISNETRTTIQLPYTDSSNLKSTSLIMKTIKSANQFDEAMKNLSIVESEQSPSQEHFREYPLASISSTSSLSTARSSSIQSKLSTTLETIQHSNAAVNFDTINKSNLSKNSISPTMLTMGDKSTTVPIAAPRIKKIGSTTGLNHQLSQLRRIYEAADQTTNLENYENEDNEVKLYFDSNRDEQDEGTSELSGSWSRVRARRNIMKEYQKQSELKQIVQHPEIQKTTTNDAILPNTNKMSIIFRSPNPSPTNIASSDLSKKPLPKPRLTTLSDSESTIQNTSKSLSSVTSTTETRREPSRKYFPVNSNDKSVFQKNDFRPVNGARKLKEHELSYFGLRVSSNKSQQNEHIEGKLSSDKPDLLLNHSAIDEKPQSQKMYPKKVVKQNLPRDTSTEAVPIYENLRTTISQNRKLDLERDERNLKELNEAADEIQKAVFAKRDKSPKRIRTNSIPFDTIEEEAPKTMKSKAVQVSRGYNQILHKIKPLHKTSSASSSESINSLKRTSSTSNHQKSERHRSSTAESKTSRRKCSKEHPQTIYYGPSKKRDNLSSRENSMEEINKEQHRSRKSSSSKEKVSSSSRSERHGISSSSRSSDKINSRKQTSKSDSSRDRVKSINPAEKSSSKHSTTSAVTPATPPTTTFGKISSSLRLRSKRN